MKKLSNGWMQKYLLAFQWIFMAFQKVSPFPKQFNPNATTQISSSISFHDLISEIPEVWNWIFQSNFQKYQLKKTVDDFKKNFHSLKPTETNEEKPLLCKLTNDTILQVENKICSSPQYISSSVHFSSSFLKNFPKVDEKEKILEEAHDEIFSGIFDDLFHNEKNRKLDETLFLHTKKLQVFLHSLFFLIAL